MDVHIKPNMQITGRCKMRAFLWIIIAISVIGSADAAEMHYTLTPSLSQKTISIDVACEGERTMEKDGSWYCTLSKNLAYTIDKPKNQSKPVNIVCNYNGKTFFFSPAGGVNATFYGNGNLQRCEAANDFSYDLDPWQKAHGGDPDVECRGRGTAWFNLSGSLRSCDARPGRYAANDDKLYDCRGDVVFNDGGDLNNFKSDCQIIKSQSEIHSLDKTANIVNQKTPQPATSATPQTVPSQAVRPDPPTPSQLPSTSGNYTISPYVSGGIHNMRDGPGAGHNIVVAIPGGSSGVSLGECRAPDDGRSKQKWCRAEWSGYLGWISKSGIVGSL